ncbi:MAG: PAS domain S-box protein [Pseudanabaena sp.]
MVVGFIPESQIYSQIKNSSPLVVNPNTTVLEAIAQMSEADSSYVLVMASDEIDSGSDLLGILTRGDIIRMTLKGCTFDQLFVKDAMCSPVITIQESELTDTKSALVLFYSYQISRLPVLDGDRLVGVLTQNDLIDLLAENVLESKSFKYKTQNSLNLPDIQIQDESCLSLLFDTYEELQLNIEELKTIEEELRLWNIELENIKRQYQDLFDFAPDGYLVTDCVGLVVLSANLAICNFLSISKEDLYLKNLHSLVDPSDIPLLYSNLRQGFGENATLTWEMSLKLSDDSYCPVEVSVSKILCLLDNSTTLQWLFRDISDRRRAQQALQELNQSLATKIEQRTNELWQVNKLQRTILDSTDYSIITTDLDGIIQIFNHGAEQMLGYSMGEIIGQATPTIFCDAQELAELAATLSAELGQDLPNGFVALTAQASLDVVCEKELTNIRKDGSRFPVLLSITALRNEKEQVIGFLGISKDISDRKEAEATLKQQLDAIEAASDGIAILRDYKYTYLNKAHVRLFGYEHSEELIGKSWEKLYSPEGIVRANKEIFPALERDRAWSGEVTVLRKDGSSFDEELSLTLTDSGLLICVCRDISDRKKAEALLQATNQELLRATRLKDEFLANMSHELRTPLNAILGITESLSEGVFGAIQEKQKSMLQVVEDSGNHLLELINDILDLAKIEADEMTLECQASNIKDICQSSMMFVRQMAIQKNLQLDLRGDPSEIETSLDERRIRQVLINLLSNAIKFTPSGGKITLEYSLERKLPFNENTSLQDWVYLKVTDTGIGITADNLQKLFQPFIQIDSQLNRQYDGTGLGLALVKKIVELHGGYVRATSEVGVGSQFAIALPYSSDISEQPQKPANIPPSPSEIIDGERYLPLVLLAEDNEDNFLTLTTYLVAKGFQLKIARNGQQAIDLVQIEPPDLILMDIQMPEVDGLEAIKYIRSQGFTMPIIATTALVMTGDRERCLAAGADDYISKPIKLKLLFTTIQQLFSKKNQSNNES